MENKMSESEMIQFIADNGGQFFYKTVSGEIGECSYSKNENIEAYKEKKNEIC